MLLYSDEAPPDHRACDAGRAAAHEGVGHCFTGISELGNPIKNELERLLCGVIAVLNVEDPDGMMPASVPALLSVWLDGLQQ